MKKLKHLVISSVFAIIATSAGAHSNHGDYAPISSEEAAARGTQVVAALVQDKQLDGAWQQNSTTRKVSSRDTANGKVWVVSYHNPQAQNAEQRTLYVILDELGNYLGANYTGKIE